MSSAHHVRADSRWAGLSRVPDSGQYLFGLFERSRGLFFSTSWIFRRMLVLKYPCAGLISQGTLRLSILEEYLPSGCLSGQASLSRTRRLIHINGEISLIWSSKDCAESCHASCAKRSSISPLFHSFPWLESTVDTIFGVTTSGMVYKLRTVPAALANEPDQADPNEDLLDE